MIGLISMGRQLSWRVVRPSILAEITARVLCARKLPRAAHHPAQTQPSKSTPMIIGSQFLVKINCQIALVTTSQHLREVDNLVRSLGLQRWPSTARIPRNAQWINPAKLASAPDRTVPIIRALEKYKRKPRSSNLNLPYTDRTKPTGVDYFTPSTRLCLLTMCRCVQPYGIGFAARYVMANG